MSFGFFADAGLTTPLADLAVTQVVGGSPADRLVYLGSATAGKKLQASSNPGVDQVQVSVTDGSPGSGLATTAVKLALSSAGLTSATGGAALDVGATILSGTSGAVPVFIRIDTGAGAPQVFTDLSLAVIDVVESDV